MTIQRCTPALPFYTSGRLPILALALLFFLLGCQSVIPKAKVALPAAPAVRAAPAEAENAFHQAETARIEQKYPEAQRLFEQFLQARPNAALADQAWFGLGEVRQIQGLDTPAMEAFEALIRHYPQSPLTAEARLRLADLQIAAGRFDEAQAALGPVLTGPADPGQQTRAWLLSGRAFLKANRRLQAVEPLIQAYHSPDALNQSLARGLILEDLGRMSVQELEQAQTLTNEPFPAGQIAYLIAYRAYQTGRSGEARRQIQQFLADFPEHELTGPVRELGRAMESGLPLPPLAIPTRAMAEAPADLASKPAASSEPPADFASTNLACLLPLSGDWSGYGEKVLRGVRLAFKLYPPKTAGFRARLLEMDSAGNPGKAVRNVEDAAGRTDILAVIGPLTKATAESAAARAEGLGLPMVSLSKQEGVTQAGKYIFRLLLTPEEQARTVARYAVQILGLTRLAILHPTDSYGARMRDVFWDEVSRLGAEVVGVQEYEPGATDFSKQIEALAGVAEFEKRVEAGRVQPVDFEAVFLPDDDQAAAIAAPYFSYYDIHTLFLGTALWHTPRLLQTAARDLQGAVLPTSFYSNANRPEVQRFVEAYRQEYDGHEPGRFEAYGFDAATLLLTLLDTRQIVTREDLVRELRRLQSFPGVTGTFSFDQSGESKTTPLLLKVEGESFVPVQ